MKISDEVRELAGEAGIYSNACGKLRELADRIDRELVELPKDRDGVPINLLDEVNLSNGKSGRVTRIDYRINQECAVLCWASRRIFEYSPTDITHPRTDSWERIADELDEQACSLTKDGYTWQEDAIHDFADRIRKLAKDGE